MTRDLTEANPAALSIDSDQARTADDAGRDSGRRRRVARAHLAQTRQARADGPCGVRHPRCRSWPPRQCQPRRPTAGDDHQPRTLVRTDGGARCGGAAERAPCEPDGVGHRSRTVARSRPAHRRHPAADQRRDPPVRTDGRGARRPRGTDAGSLGRRRVCRSSRRRRDSCRGCRSHGSRRRRGRKKRLPPKGGSYNGGKSYSARARSGNATKAGSYDGGERYSGERYDGGEELR